jgi:RNA polymerase sigma factor for flagellar operon FliA
MENRLGSAELTEAWTRYKLHGDLQARNALALHYQQLVHAVAGKIARQLPRNVDREDLVSYGIFGLLDALEKFDVERNIQFETYAGTRIRGNIFDGIRGLDWVPRAVRAKGRDVERAEEELYARLGRPPEDTELAVHLGVSLIELWHIQTQIELGQVDAYDSETTYGTVTGSGHLRTPVDTNTPDALFDTLEVSELLAEAINQMPQRSKTILTLYYLQGMTLAEIGVVLGVTESRVCQLQSKLLQTLHASLQQGLMAA